LVLWKNKLNGQTLNQTKRMKDNIQINKIRDQKGLLQQTSLKFRGSLENISKTYSMKLKSLEDIDKLLDT
jgi:hypothetical protein